MLILKEISRINQSLHIHQSFEVVFKIFSTPTGINSSQEGNRTMQASFNSLYLGGKDKLLPLMQESFPELGLVSEERTEMSWIQSMVYFAGFSSEQSPDILLTRGPSILYFKGKSDYVKNPIPEIGLEGI